MAKPAAEGPLHLCHLSGKSMLTPSRGSSTYGAKVVCSLGFLGEEVSLDTLERVAAYLESTYAENPM